MEVAGNAGSGVPPKIQPEVIAVRMEQPRQPRRQPPPTLLARFLPLDAVILMP